MFLCVFALSAAILGFCHNERANMSPFRLMRKGNITMLGRHEANGGIQSLTHTQESGVMQCLSAEVFGRNGVRIYGRVAASNVNENVLRRNAHECAVPWLCGTAKRQQKEAPKDNRATKRGTERQKATKRGSKRP